MSARFQPPAPLPETRPREVRIDPSELAQLRSDRAELAVARGQCVSLGVTVTEAHALLRALAFHVEHGRPLDRETAERVERFLGPVARGVDKP